MQSTSVPMAGQLTLNAINENEQHNTLAMQTPPTDGMTPSIGSPELSHTANDGQLSNEEEEDQAVKKQDDDDDEIHVLFGDSSHQYLIYYGDKEHPSSDLNGLIMGIVSLLVQYVLLSFILAEGQTLLKDDLLPVTVPFGYCESDKPSSLELRCDTGDSDAITMLLAPILLAIFLMSDTVIALKAIFIAKGFISKICTIALFIVSCFACYVGGVFSFQGMFSGSQYDAIVNCVGVLFICDIDEKAYATYKAVEDIVSLDRIKNWRIFQCKCCQTHHRVKCCMILCCVIFMVMASLPAMFEQQATEEYPIPSTPAAASGPSPASSPDDNYGSYSYYD